MADFRKAKYSGSLNLAPECGPVLIELDTDAKTATASLEDPASQYTLAGGGGGLDYVIPEQTVTVSGGVADVEINTNQLSDGDYIILKLDIEGSISYSCGDYSSEDDKITFDSELMGYFVVSTGKWYIEAPDSTVSISAIRGF